MKKRFVRISNISEILMIILGLAYVLFFYQYKWIAFVIVIFAFISFITIIISTLFTNKEESI
jgi:hypothetical protein